MNRIRLFTVLLALIFTVQNAHAAFIDGYQDRQNMFFGLNIGGGGGSTDSSGADMDTVGFMGAARIGGGITKTVTLDFEPSYWYGSDEVAGIDTALHQLGFLVNANFFVLKDLFLRAGLGFTVSNVDPDVGSSDSESGLGINMGVGYDAFMNSNLAFTISGFYRRYFYDPFDFNLFGLSVGITWY